MVSNGVLAAVAAVGVIVAAGIVLDQRRRSDPKYQQKLKHRKREEKLEKERQKKAQEEAAKKKAEAKKSGASPLPDKNDPEAKEKYFMDELQAGEDALHAKDLEGAITHFVNAVSIHDHPQMILGQLATVLPEPIIEIIVKCCDPEIFRDNYFDTFPAELTDKVEIKPVEGSAKERVVLAKCDLKAGDVIAEEEPMAAVFGPDVATSDLCGHCHKKVPGRPVQCKEKCGWETYCNEKCRDYAWDQQHHLFCGKGTKEHSAAAHRLLTFAKETKDSEPLLVGRLLARAFPADQKKDARDFTKDIAHLHYKSPLPEVNAAHDNAASNIRAVMKGKVEIIDDVLTTPSYVALLSKVQQNKLPFKSVPESDEVTGHGVFRLGAFFNHSCDPNIKVESAGGSKLAYVATRDIKKGEEVCRAYTDELSGKSTKERMDHLKEQFGFQCECPPCSGKVVMAPKA